MDAVTDLDRRQAERVSQLKRKRVVAGEAQGANDTASDADTPRHQKARKGERWAAYNAFVDVIAPWLPLADRAVWHVMFRYARDGSVETSERALATAAGMDKVTAGKALRRLVVLRLVWPIHKSTDKARLSKYGLHPDPASRLAAVIEAHERTPKRKKEPGESLTRLET